MNAALLPPLAVVAGTASFSSPGCLLLVPGYLSSVSSLPVGDLGRHKAPALARRASVPFKLGFTVVSTALGLAVGLLGSTVTRNLPTVVRPADIGIIILGLAMTGLVRIPILYRGWRSGPAKSPRGPRGALPLAMPAEWTPCIGPVLATVLATGAAAGIAAGTAAWGGVLLASYSVGLGLPCLLLAVGFTRARESMDWLRRHGRAIEGGGGIMLRAVGGLFVSGAMRTLLLPLRRSFARWGWRPI